jgi:tetratricopeptide (TPR) repeat protein
VPILSAIRPGGGCPASRAEDTTTAGRGGRWQRFLAGVLLLAAFGAGGVYLGRRWSQRELHRARQAIARQEWGEARQQLRSLARWRPLVGDEEVDYWLGLCEWNAGRYDAALDAFRRIPAGSEFEASAALWQAEALVMRWRFGAAEDRLLQALRPGRSGLGPIRERLVKLGRMEARFDEVRAWLRGAFADADDPVGVLRQLWLLDRGLTASEGVRLNLERALARSPDDDRVWLGLARIHTREGRFEEAAGWLGRCVDRRPDDRSVDRARMDLAYATGDAGELARVLAGRLQADFDPSERIAWRARLAELRGEVGDERRILERWLDAEPQNPAALERVATLLAQAGDIGRAAEFRRRKARVDEAIDRYHRRISGPGRFATAAERVAMARLADEAGRPFDSQAWCQLAARLDPKAPGAADILARLEKTKALLREVSAGDDGPGRSSRGPTPTHDGRSIHRPHLEFRDDAEAAGLGFTFNNGESAIRQLPVTMSGGIGLLDYDGDGWLDVYAVQGGRFPPEPATRSHGDRLFRNRGLGTFEDVTEPAGIGKIAGGYGHGVAIGDYDGDGHPDVFITRWRSYALYRNKGDGTFEDMTEAAGLGGDRDWPTSAAFADLDGDGDLDLYVCHYLRWNADDPRICRDAQTHAYATCSPREFPALPDHVFRNDGGRFRDVTSAAGIVDEDGRGLGVVASDLDGDGRVDLFVANDQSANYFFRNLGAFRFEEVGHDAGLASSSDGGYKAGMGVACGDLNGDGRPDLAVTNFYGESTTLYKNLGNGLFSDGTSASGLASPSRHLLGFGASFLDSNNDGHLDLMTANGHLDRLLGMPYKMPVQLLLGDGGRLRDATAEAGPALFVPRIGRALAAGDLDNDGRVDGLVLGHDGPLAYLHNQSAGCGHFVVLRLEGTRSNRDAVGARVVVTAGGIHHTAWRIGGGSYQSASDPRLHIGIGRADCLDAIEVTWPSGDVQRFQHLPVDRGYLLRESADRPLPLLGFTAN